MGTVFRMLCGLFVLLLVGAVQPKASVAMVVDVDGIKIEFSMDNNSQIVVKKNDKEVKATKVKNVEVTLYNEDGSSITKPKLFKDSTLIYKINPTCVAYTDGRNWYQYCW